jgi:D-lyxose ketol-isomerase
MSNINRREAIGGLAAGAVVTSSLLATGCNQAPSASSAPMGWKTPVNKDFYKADGSFDADKAKQAYYDMMTYYNYPILDRLRGEEFWTVDFGLDNFTEVGMAGILWINNKEHNYLGHEIYLLPGQMIPEHWHVRTDDAAPKLEAWQLRYGTVTLYSEGEPTSGGKERIPPIHRDIAVARTEMKLLPGEVGKLAAAEQKHWMLAGSEGAIVTEYATYHDGNALRFTHPGIKF